MADDFTYKEVQTGLPTESALEVASAVANAIPWIGGPLASVLSGISAGRKLDRVKEVVMDVASELRDFKSEASQAYVKTEEFEELLENTLRQTANERSEEKRQLLRSFLVGAIKNPTDYDEQIRFLRLVDELQPQHMVLLRALSQAPQREEQDGLVGSVIGTLRRRIPDLTEAQVEERITQTNDLRITNVTSLHVMMTPSGAADLRQSITPTGQRLLSFIGSK